MGGVGGGRTKTLGVCRRIELMHLFNLIVDG